MPSAITAKTEEAIPCEERPTQHVDDLRHALVELGACLMAKRITALRGWLYWETEDGESGFYMALPRSEDGRTD
jgi:hypothetical protein